MAGLGALFVVVWRHNPTRKLVQRTLDPTWHRRSALPDFDPEELAHEARRMYVSSTVMRDGCDVIWDEFDDEPPQGFTGPHADGTVVWVNTMHVPRFITEFLPRMRGRFVLVTARENNSTAGFDHAAVLGNPNVLHWFIENFEFPAEVLETGKITPLPLGLNYHKLDPESPNQSRDMGLPASPAQQQAAMNRIRRDIAPIRERPLKVYANFHLNMDTFLRHPHAQKRALARAEARDALKDKPFMVWEPIQAPRNTVWKRHQEAAFEASPRGNSIDCHRTYEALILRSIPIVKSCEMDPLYDGLPVAIVGDWSEVTEAQLAKWRDEFAPWFDQPLPPEMFSDHWIRRFHSFKPGTGQRPGQ